MKKMILILLVLNLKLSGQDTTVRSFGAIPTDISILSTMEVAVPLSGAATQIPSSFRMDNDCPPVTNQCLTGSCVSEATAYGLCGILAKRQNLTDLFSSMYMHYYIKQPNQANPPKCLANDCRCMGSSLGLAANFLKEKGIPNLESWHPDQCNINACKEAPGQKTSAFKLVSTKPLFFPGVQYTVGYKKDIIRYYVSQNYPIPIAMFLDESFVNASAFNNQYDTWRYFIGQSAGGHAMLVVGYDDKRGKGAFLVMNSWGTTDWNTVKHDRTNDAKPGYCWIAYDIIDKYAYEAFVANENLQSYSIPVSDLLLTTKSVFVSENKSIDSSAFTNDDVEFFITNRYNPYDSIRLIPTRIDKINNEATVAIYKLENNTPVFYSAFNIKVGETLEFTVNDHKYTFKAVDIKPWRKYLKIFNGKSALFYRITIE